MLVPHGSPGTMHAWPNLPGKAFPEHYQVGCPAGTLLAVPHSGLHSSPVMARVMHAWCSTVQGTGQRPDKSSHAPWPGHHNRSLESAQPSFSVQDAAKPQPRQKYLPAFLHGHDDSRLQLHSV